MSADYRSSRCRPVRLTARLYLSLGLREWGVPTGRFTGSAWRFFRPKDLRDDRPLGMSCMVPSGRTRLRVESRRVVFVEDESRVWLPAPWRRALARYLAQWPESASRLHRVAARSPKAAP